MESSARHTNQFVVLSVKDKKTTTHVMMIACRNVHFFHFFVFVCWFRFFFFGRGLENLIMVWCVRATLCKQ